MQRLYINKNILESKKYNEYINKIFQKVKNKKIVQIKVFLKANNTTVILIKYSRKSKIESYIYKSILEGKNTRLYK